MQAEGIKSVTVSFTVPTGQGESLQVGATGDTLEDLIIFFGVDCQKIGQADPELRERLDAALRKYFGRDLVHKENEYTPAKESTPKKEPAAPGKQTTPPPAAAPKQEKAATSPPEKEKKPSPPPAAKPEKEAKAGVCEKCGVDVTAAERKMSQLFTSKTLCRACLSKETGK